MVASLQLAIATPSQCGEEELNLAAPVWGQRWPNPEGGISIGRIDAPTNGVTELQTLVVATQKTSRTQNLAPGSMLNMGQVFVTIAGTSALEFRIHGQMRPATVGADEAAGPDRHQHVFNFGSGIDITSSQTVTVTATPASAAGIRWSATLILESGAQSATVTTVTTTATQTILSFTAGATETIKGLKVTAEPVGAITGLGALYYCGIPFFEIPRHGMDETINTMLDNRSLAGGMGVLTIPMWGIKFREDEHITMKAHPAARDTTRWGLGVYGEYTAAGGGGAAYRVVGSPVVRRVKA